MPQKIRRCAIYRRISDEDSQRKGTSLSDQLDATRAQIVKDGGVVKEEHIFTDTLSGAGKYWRDRDGIQEMLVCAKRHEFDYLYISELDRFGRDVVIQEFMIQELRHYGVIVYSLKIEERTDRNDFISQMARWFWGKMAEEELNKIRERTQRGIHGRVIKKGALLPGSRPLYGYHWQDKQMEWQGEMIIVPKAHYVIFEPEMKYVKGMFQWCKLRIPVARMAHMLTEKGIPAPNGGKIWRATTVHNILTNEAYTGVHFAFKRRYEFIQGEGMRRRIRPQDEWISIDDACIPGVVDKDTFEECQKLLALNKEQAARNNPNVEDTLMRGYCFCAYCKSKLSVQRDKVRDRINYRCYKEAQGYGECRGTNVFAPLLDQEAWMKAIAVIQNPCLVEREIEKQRIEDPTQGSLKAAEEVLSKTVEGIINLTQSLETTKEPLARAILTKRLEELAMLKARQEDEYDQILRYRINWEDAMRSLDDFKNWCDSVRPNLGDPEFKATWKEMRDAIEKIGIRVIVYRNGHKPRLDVQIGPPQIMSKFRPIVSKSSSAF